MRNLLLNCWLVACSMFPASLVWAESDWKPFSAPAGQGPSALVLPDMTDKTIDLSAFKGQVVLVNFWATWCEPCRDEMPSLNRLQQQLASRNFRVVGVNVGEGKPRIEQFIKRIPVDFTIARDAESSVMKTWRVRILPASFLIDKHGMLRYQLIGDANWDDEKIRAPILDLLK